MLQCRRAEELRFGPRALKDALLSSDAGLRQHYVAAFSPAERLFLAEAYNPQGTLFGPPRIHSAFDWLLSRPEPPEDFQTFHEALAARRPSLGPKHIYLQPIDAGEGPVGGALLVGVQSCAEAFFLGLQVKCLPSVAASAIRCRSRPGQGPARLQLHTDGILSFLRSHKPGDALCVLAVTLTDLYPCEAWSFTFGKSLPGLEVGVCSFARFSRESSPAGPSTCDPGPAEAAPGGPESPARDTGCSPSFSALGVVQCCQAACHELCRLLGLGRCRWLRCLMQGALSLDEALRRPPDLCPVCLRKLQHILGFRLIDRYKRLHAWTDAVAGPWPAREAGELSVSEDSGVGGESDPEAVTSVSEPLSPDAGPELEPEGAPRPLAEVGAASPPGGPAEPLAAVREHRLWLAACIRALERQVREEELAQVDGAVDALARWDMFPGRPAATRRDLPGGRDGSGLRQALGDKLASLRKRFSARTPAKAGSPPRRWKWEEK
ncbi:archaemetzincin-1 [Tamandua tetradactyla]|uniref:archaemetzincin-1 n=1 Tax=Tamandua tetradactyla TaxID=48850 RepID=UPI0040539FC2